MLALASATTCVPQHASSSSFSSFQHGQLQCHMLLTLTELSTLHYQHLHEGG